MLRRLAPVLVMLAVALTQSPASAFAQQQDLSKTLTEIEKSLWEGWANHDAEPFRKHITENFVTVNRAGVETGKEAEIQGVESHPCEVASYSFSDWAVHRVSDGVALLTYRATQDVTCNGESLPSKVIVASTYVRKDGEWRSASYHETPAANE